MEYNFELEKKYTVWEKESHSIEASSCDEAVKEMKLHINDEYKAPDSCDTSEIIFDTMTFIYPEDNGLEPTIELFNENYELISDNKQ